MVAEIVEAPGVDERPEDRNAHLAQASRDNVIGLVTIATMPIAGPLGQKVGSAVTTRLLGSGAGQLAARGICTTRERAPCGTYFSGNLTRAKT